MISKISRGMILMGVVAVVLSGNTVSAQFPNWKAKPVRPLIDVIPPLGNNLPYSYRARMNRPTYLGGRIAYTIEPTSQEAMAWQRAWERGYYADHAPRMETHYIFPKPWEALGVGAKPKRGDDAKAVYPEPERLPIGPAVDAGDPNEDEPAGGAESQVPGKPLKPETLETPEAEAAELRESVNATPALVPRLRDGSRPRVDAPAALELAPTIELSPILTLE